MAEAFDLVIVGSGSASTSAAFDCAAAGLKTAVIDNRPFGGTCALRGCDPKKVLVGMAELSDWAERMGGHGAAMPATRVQWKDLMTFKRTFTEPFPAHIEGAFKSSGIASYHGTVSFISQNELSMDGTRMSANRILIASGSRPAPLGVTGEELLTYSDQFLDLQALPKRMVFAGGGYISVEFANVAARAGVRVTLLHRGSVLLKGFDPDLARGVEACLSDAGVDVVLGAAFRGISRAGKALEVQYEREGKQETIGTDMVVHGAGRIPFVDDLDLPAGNVTADARGVVVNEFLQSTSNASVYAAGDAAHTQGPPLTPIAVAEGTAAGQNIINGNSRTVNYTAIPSVVFNVPPLASVGMQEEEARKLGLPLRVNAGDTASWYSSRRTNTKHSGYKVIIDSATDKILGAHLLGPHAEEVINIFAMALQLGISASELKKRIFTYPTNSSDVRYML